MPLDKNNKRRYQKEYQATPTQKKAKAKRHQARKAAVERGSAHKGDGKHVDHTTPIKKGGGNADNTRVMSKKANLKKGDR